MDSLLPQCVMRVQRGSINRPSNNHRRSVHGASLLWHLAHEGWTDIVLVEKAEFTSGSTWHTAGKQPEGLTPMDRWATGWPS